MKRRRDKEEADDATDPINQPKRQKLTLDKWLGKESSTSNNNKNKDDDSNNNNNKDKDDDANNNKNQENSWILGGTNNYSYYYSVLLFTKVHPIIEIDTIKITSSNPLDEKYIRIITATVHLWAVKDKPGIDSAYTIMARATITKHPWAETLNCNVNAHISWIEIDKLISNYLGDVPQKQCPFINIRVKNLNEVSDELLIMDTYCIKQYNYDSIISAAFNSNDITKIHIAIEIWFSYYKHY